MMTAVIFIFVAFVLALLQACRPWIQVLQQGIPHLGWLAVAVYFLSLLLGGR